MAQHCQGLACVSLHCSDFLPGTKQGSKLGAAAWTSPWVAQVEGHNSCLFSCTSAASEKCHRGNLRNASPVLIPATTSAFSPKRELGVVVLDQDGC